MDVQNVKPEVNAGHGQHDVSLTDFIYAVVVGSAFQNIKLPLDSDKNALIVISFLLILDDWILYHAQCSRLPLRGNSFALRLGLDVLVLTLWYSAAVQATDGLSGIGKYLVALAAYYFATALWEIVFHRETRNSVRLWCDLICCAYLATWAAVIDFGPIAEDQLWAWALFIPLFIFRIPAWRSLVLNQKEPMARQAKAINGLPDGAVLEDHVGTT